MSADKTEREQMAAYRLPSEAVLIALGTDMRAGLSEAEALVRLQRHGRNELPAGKQSPAWMKFLAQFRYSFSPV